MKALLAALWLVLFLGAARADYGTDQTAYAAQGRYDLIEQQVEALRAKGPLRTRDQQRVDARLAGALAAEAALAHVDPLGLGGFRTQCRVGQRVGQHDLCRPQPVQAAHGDQVGRAGAGADEDDANVGGHRHRVRAQAPTSSAPLVRLVVGSTTISAPPTRLSA